MTGLPAADTDIGFTLARLLGGGTRQVDVGRDTGNGLAKLVLALVNLIHELLERQAMRRIEGGALTDAQAEALGEALMRQALTILELCDRLGITEDDLAIDLGPLGRLSGEHAMADAEVKHDGVVLGQHGACGPGLPRRFAARNDGSMFRRST